MNVTADLQFTPRQLRTELARSLRRGGRGFRSAQDAARKAYIRELQSPNSPWPVDTGLSKASFFFSQQDGTLQNSTTYAPVVEARTGAAEQVLDRLRGSLSDDADKAVQAFLDKEF